MKKLILSPWSSHILDKTRRVEARKKRKREKKRKNIKPGNGYGEMMNSNRTDKKCPDCCYSTGEKLKEAHETTSFKNIKYVNRNTVRQSQHLVINKIIVQIWQEFQVCQVDPIKHRSNIYRCFYNQLILLRCLDMCYIDQKYQLFL